MYRFIHFGCWNNLNKKNNLNGVMQKLKDYIEETRSEPIKFISISGDNYYPEKVKTMVEGKEKKQKTIIKERLDSGFDCLPSGDFEYVMIMGNHDLETNLYINEQDKETNCSILRSELDKKSDICLFNSKVIQFEEHQSSLCLFLDTSIYDHSDNVKYLSCYKIFIELNPSQFKEELKLLKKELMKTPNIPDITNFKEWVMETVDDVEEDPSTYMYDESLAMNMYTLRTTGTVPPALILLNDTTDLMVLFILYLQKQYVKKQITELKEKGLIKNIIMIGHHPIVCIKKKEKDDESFNTSLTSDIHILFNDFFHSSVVSMFDITDQPTYYYLCADLHLYQSGTITLHPSDIVIHQYVVGTGGTPLDEEITEEDISTLTTTNLSPYIEYEIKDKLHEFGFLNCTISPDHSIQFDFIVAPVIKSENRCTVKGGNRKRYTKKYKH
jgi:hypothetical protein